MAKKATSEAKTTPELKKKRVIKKTETVREKATKQSQATPKTRRLHKATTAVKRPIIAAHRIGKKEYHPFKLPDNKIGRFLTKTRRFTPAFIRNAWGELKLVTWPNNRETARLSFAVFMFAIVLGVVVAIVDYGLDKLFKQLLLK